MAEHVYCDIFDPKQAGIIETVDHGTVEDIINLRYPNTPFDKAESALIRLLRENHTTSTHYFIANECQGCNKNQPGWYWYSRYLCINCIRSLSNRRTIAPIDYVWN